MFSSDLKKTFSLSILFSIILFSVIFTSASMVLILDGTVSHCAFFEVEGVIEEKQGALIKKRLKVSEKTDSHIALKEQYEISPRGFLEMSVHSDAEKGDLLAFCLLEKSKGK